MKLLAAIESAKGFLYLEKICRAPVQDKLEALIVSLTERIEGEERRGDRKERGGEEKTRRWKEERERDFCT